MTNTKGPTPLQVLELLKQTPPKEAKETAKAIRQANAGRLK